MRVIPEVNKNNSVTLADISQTVVYPSVQAAEPRLVKFNLSTVTYIYDQ